VVGSGGRMVRLCRHHAAASLIDSADGGVLLPPFRER
jgi:hypothetical protein